MTSETQELTDAEWEAQIPKPVGYHLLIKVPETKDTFEGSSIVKVDAERKRDQIMTMVGLVLDMGPDAYTDKSRFPSGPWCKTGDYILFRMNSGTRFAVNGKEFRLMNDDSIEAVVPDPQGINRV